MAEETETETKPKQELDPLVYPTCPVCGNQKESYVVMQFSLAAEDTLKPDFPGPSRPGAGVTHPAFKFVQARGKMVICRKCGVMYVPPSSIVAAR